MFDIDEYIIFNFIVVALGITYGIVAQRKQFCFSGSLKDIIILNNTQRLNSVLIATITSILATQFIAWNFNINLELTKYFVGINYIFIIIGGLMFGYGMMKSDGCGSRHIIKFAQGDKMSFYVLIVIGISAYLTYTFLPIFVQENDFIAIGYTKKTWAIPIYILLFVLAVLLYKSLKITKNIFQNIDGMLIGVLVSIGWYISAVLSLDMFVFTNAQSFSFIYPVGKILQYTFSFSQSHLIFGVLIVFGVLIGAFLSSKISNKTASKTTYKNVAEKLIGGAFVGSGGVLLIGCTVGQGLSGLSTLSFASLLGVVCVYISGYITGVSMNKKNNLSTSFKT